MVLVTTAIFLFQTSCKKELSTSTNPQKISPSNGAVFNIGGDTENKTKSDLIQTVLGEKKENPYTLANMNQAYHNIYDSSTNLETTHYYVKFTPKTYEEVMKLTDNDILLLDFPYEYDVVKMGDYYQKLSEGELPVLYSVVSVDFNLAEYNHQIIDNLYITDNPFLLLEAFNLKGRYKELASIEIPIDDDIILPPKAPPMPEEGCNAPCHWVMYNQNPNNEYPPNWAYKCDCPTPPDPSACLATDHAKKPYGQIKVDDTQLSVAGNSSTYQGVSHIKVFVTGVATLWNSGMTTTNQYGCWKYDKKMWFGARFWTKFQSSTCCIRGLKNNVNIVTYPISFLSGVIDYVGLVYPSNFHNIQVNYNRNAADNSNAYLYWSAATTNNAIHEFNTYAIQEGINTTPNNLNVFVKYQSEDGGGAAIMFRRLSWAEIDNWAQSLSLSPDWDNTFIGELLDNQILRMFFTGFVSALKNLAPDIILAINTTHSDELKHLVYHEVAHSSHFTNTSNAFWVNVMIAESNAYMATGEAHGNAAFADADIIAVAESWAEHIGKTFADKTYGNNNSLTNYPTYNKFLEKQRDESFNHIPIGLYHDLADGVNISETAYDGAWANTGVAYSINDNISGLTNAQLFNLLDVNTISPSIFIQKLNSSGIVQTPNSVTGVNNLFNSY